MNKKGLSAVLSMVLLILFIAIGVAFLWGMVSNFLHGKESSLNSGSDVIISDRNANNRLPSEFNTGDPGSSSEGGDDGGPTPSCTDSDSGRTHDIQGEVTCGSTILSDYCVNPSVLHDYYYDPGIDDYAEEEVSCGSGKECEGGLCIASSGNDLGTQSNPASSCLEIYNTGQTSDGDYWIDPDVGGPVQAFETRCDMGNGGWTLLMRISSTSGEHATNNEQVGDFPCDTSVNEICKVSTETINAFLAQTGEQVIKIKPDVPLGSLNYIPWYIISRSVSDEWPTNLECKSSNNDNIKSTKHGWILNNYQFYGDAVADSNVAESDCSGNNGFYYPTTYKPGNDKWNFFNIETSNGLRVSTLWSGGSIAAGKPGTLWIK